MVRGETFLPKERFGFVTNSIDNVASNLNGKYYKQVNGVKGTAVLLEINNSLIKAGTDYRFGYYNSIDVSDNRNWKNALIVWINERSSKPILIKISQKSN